MYDTLQLNVLVEIYNKKCISYHPIGRASSGGGKFNLKDYFDDHGIRGGQVFYVCKSETNCSCDESLWFLV